MFVPSVADEHFRDLVRAIEDLRGELMRARHRLSKLQLRNGHRYQDGKAWTLKHAAWLRSLHFDDPCAQVTLADYLASIGMLSTRRAALFETLQAQAPSCSHAASIERLRCFRGIDTLSAAGPCAEISGFERFQRPNMLSGFLGTVPSERTSDRIRRQGSITKAGSEHARRLLVVHQLTTNHPEYPAGLDGSAAATSSPNRTRGTAVLLSPDVGSKQKPHPAKERLGATRSVSA